MLMKLPQSHFITVVNRIRVVDVFACKMRIVFGISPWRSVLAKLMTLEPTAILFKTLVLADHHSAPKETEIQATPLATVNIGFIQKV